MGKGAGSLILFNTLRWTPGLWTALDPNRGLCQFEMGAAAVPYLYGRRPPLPIASDMFGFGIVEVYFLNYLPERSVIKLLVYV